MSRMGKFIHLLIFILYFSRFLPRRYLRSSADQLDRQRLFVSGLNTLTIVLPKIQAS